VPLPIFICRHNNPSAIRTIACHRWVIALAYEPAIAPSHKTLELFCPHFTPGSTTFESHHKLASPKFGYDTILQKNFIILGFEIPSLNPLRPLPPVDC
jgi:hypothetical protein